MTDEQQQRFMRLLTRAKGGDECACGELARGLAQHFSYMIKRFRSVDPAYDLDDLMDQFMIGIWNAIDKVDERGDPLYHLARRGAWEVSSLLKMIKRRRHGMSEWTKEYGKPGEYSVGTLPEGWDPRDLRPEAAPEYELAPEPDQVRMQAQVTAILNHPDLGPRQRQALQALSVLSVQGNTHLNLRLARALQVSPQAAGALHKHLLEKITGRTQDAPKDYACLECGRQFATKGALTQHKRGQSGHKPCAAQIESAVPGG